MATSHKPSQVKFGNILIITHFLLYGAAHALVDYLLENKKTSELVFITLPLASQRTAQIHIYKHSQLSYEETEKRSKKESIVDYLVDFFQIMWWVISRKKQYDIFFGCGVLDAFVGVIFKKIGIVKKTIFYSIDFVPQRFSSNALNAVYHWMEKVCIKNADEVWDVSPRMAEGREKFLNISPASYIHKVVPIGVWNKNIKKVPFSKVKKHQLLFIGHLLEKQGVQQVLEVIPQVIKKIPDFHFLIIGGGEYELNLKSCAKELHIEKYVTFTGWIRERAKIDTLLGESACAVATYVPEEEQRSNFTYYADPTKIKDYLAAGLPIILTDVSYNAKEIAQNECGFVVKYDSNKIALAIITLLSNKSKLEKYRLNALAYAKTFDWKDIFDKALH